jgi:hypothetical protein
MQWRQSLPNWIRLLFVLFGIANVIGALAHLSWMTLPGIFIGFIWALVGWKGLPLIHASGIRAIRRRRLAAILAPFVWLGLAALILPRTPKQFMDTVFFVSAAPVVFFVFRFGLSACPRCGQHFLVSKCFLGSWASRCRHCGLSLNDDAGAT